MIHDPRMGLGTDQLALPAELASAAPDPHGQNFGHHHADLPAPRHSLDSDELAELAPWARRMQLPGIDT